MLLAWWINALALVVAAGLGVRALIDPNWAARFVRLKADDQPGGFAEFRATYGGLFAFAHGAAFVLTLKYLTDGDHVIGLAATGAAAPLAAAWAGAAFGRCVSMLRDGARTRFNTITAGVEALFALAIGAPWAMWFLSPPG
jgi:hypothetical protein